MYCIYVYEYRHLEQLQDGSELALAPCPTRKVGTANGFGAKPRHTAPPLSPSGVSQQARYCICSGSRKHRTLPRPPVHAYNPRGAPSALGECPASRILPSPRADLARTQGSPERPKTEMSPVHELVSCAYGASVDVVFIPPEFVGAQPVAAVPRAAALPEPAMARVARWESPRQPLVAASVQPPSRPGVAPSRPSWGSVKKFTSRFRRRSSAGVVEIDRQVPPAATADQPTGQAAAVSA